MRRVPLLVITLCRYDHFKKCIESLAANRMAEETELFIGLDYPLNESHWEGYKKIKQFIKGGITGFADVYCVEQVENMGWYENFLSVRQKIYETYDSFIYTEDDNVFAPNFLEYMNGCMKKYKFNQKVYAIAGYNYPIAIENGTGNVFASKYYFSASGYGVWKNKESEMYSQITMSHFESLLEDRNYMRKLRRGSKNQFCNFIRGMLQYKNEMIKNNDVQKIDLTFAIQMLFEQKVMIMPCWSLVRNCGYDGSGIHCSVINNNNRKHQHYRNYDYGNQPVNFNYFWKDMIEVSKHEEKIINERIENFFDVPLLEYIRCLISYLCICLFGLKKTKLLLNKYSRE